MFEGEFRSLSYERFKPGMAAFGRCIDTIGGGAYLLHGFSMKPLVGELLPVTVRVVVSNRVLFEGPAPALRTFQTWHCPGGAPVEVHIANDGTADVAFHITCQWEPMAGPSLVAPDWKQE